MKNTHIHTPYVALKWSVDMKNAHLTPLWGGQWIWKTHTLRRVKVDSAHEEYTHTPYAALRWTVEMNTHTHTHTRTPYAPLRWRVDMNTRTLRRFKVDCGMKNTHIHTPYVALKWAVDMKNAHLTPLWGGQWLWKTHTLRRVKVDSAHEEYTHTHTPYAALRWTVEWRTHTPYAEVKVDSGYEEHTSPSC